MILFQDGTSRRLNILLPMPTPQSNLCILVVPSLSGEIIRLWTPLEGTIETATGTRLRSRPMDQVAVLWTSVFIRSVALFQRKLGETELRMIGQSGLVLIS